MLTTPGRSIVMISCLGRVDLTNELYKDTMISPTSKYIVCVCVCVCVCSVKSQERTAQFSKFLLRKQFYIAKLQIANFFHLKDVKENLCRIQFCFRT